MNDPLRDLLRSQQETQRARRDQHFVQALLAGCAPSAVAYCTALDSGLTGDEALEAAHQLDKSATAFTPDDTPPAAA